MPLRGPAAVTAAVTAAVAAATLIAVPAPASAALSNSVSDAALALHWAPVHYQDTDSTDYDADYLSTVDYDGEWDTLNNWEHQDDQPDRLRGNAYQSVVQTSTHWFVLYAYYHPRDWDDVPDPFDLLTHENDMEGTLLTVRKDGSAYGKLEAMITVAHSDFYSYTPAGSPYTSGRENIDGPVIMVSHGGSQHPTTRQEAKGHGLYAHDGKEFPGGDGVVYQPSATASEVPSGGNDRSVAYRLTDVFASGGLWAHRSDSKTFVSPGTFRGDNGKDNAANAPWGWDDKDDGDITRGMLATDPARVVATYFANTGTFSRTYTSNPYTG
ncbi:hypothetical protein EV193_107211 [Herbihabitans rhizosphaerae]|uniref:Uncharacterized protein n=1 Tax=Herbihabitans rhizosphaerae TaxID=1872711 RepID=A0A4Q7KKW5_9PSEU|nr:hypothetical protein [Herbihabitans rhizosphaerae]RZS36530.1 hypothetical protein EV193_107211 [Herbihabitans rhizosphaerae]